jgi:hypothetical protein
MTTRAYLLQLRTIDLEIAMSESEAQSWRDLATKMHHEPSEVRVDTSPAPDKMEGLVVKAADCAMKADKEREILIYTKSVIEGQIKKIEDKDMKFMLWGYYHDRKSVEDLSKEIPVTYRQGKRIIKRAVEVFEDVWGHTYL